MILRSLIVATGLLVSAQAEEGVVLLHGLARTKRSMERMEVVFRNAGYLVLNLDYASRTKPVADLADSTVGAALADPRLADCRKIHFVTHSVGGILVRSYFTRHHDPRLGRVVMLGPPNQGSEVVDHLKSWRLFRFITGPAGSQLGTRPDDSVAPALGSPSFDLGVIAGDRSLNWINSAMIPGPDDGKVSVERTKVGGMKDHLVVHATHPFLMRNRTVIAASLRFIQSGGFSPPPANPPVPRR